jgi:Transglycosylase SLT domain
MGVKSIIDVDVDDSKFRRFTELYQKYQEQLAKMPSTWTAAATEQGKSASEFERMAAALLAQNHLAKEGDDEDKKRLTRLTHSERLWTSMAKSSGSMAKSVLDIGMGVLKWGAIIAGGLVGGSLFGIDKMAGSVSNSRRSAMGLGLSIGEQKAFGINFERLMEPNFLSQVAEMRTDPSKAGPLYTMGVGASGSTETTAIALVKAMYEKAHATPEGMLGQLDNMTGMSVGFEQWYRLKQMGRPELNSLVAGNRRDIGGLNIDPATALKWQNFTTQMEKAGGTIFKVFVQGLAPLAEPLTGLSDAFTKFLRTLLGGNGPVKEGIDNVAKWLSNFSGELSRPEFLKSVEMFVSDVGWLAKALHKAAHPLDTSWDWTSDKMAGLKEWLQPSPAGVSANEKSYLAYLGRKDLQYGFPDGLLERLHTQESGGNLYPKNSPKGAIGAFGFMPDTAKQYGIDPYDPVASANAGSRYLYDLEKKYAGDLAKALAAYNWGEGNLDKDIRAHPKDWGNYAPKETQDYVRKVGGLNIVVTNQTGGSAHVSINALAAGS